MPISILNYGKQMVLSLDDDGKRFLQDGMTAVIKQLSDAGHETAKSAGGKEIKEAEPVAGFRFDDSTPNVFGKVVWDTERNSWKVTLGHGRDQHSTYKDHIGGDLAVGGDLSGDAYMREKANLYRKAIDTWNALDQTKRRRLLTPLEITIAESSPSPSKSVSSPELEGEDLLDGSCR